MTDATRTSATRRPSAALARVSRPRSHRRVARRLVFVLAAAALLLGFLPWRQTVSGNGEVVIYSPMDRPQTVEAQISATVAEWRVSEGERVKAGQVLARLVDIDAKYLDPKALTRIRQAREFAETTLRETEGRIVELGNQRDLLREARGNALDAARRAIGQSQARARAAGQRVKATEGSVQIARRVAVGSARERRAQAEDRIVQAKQSLEAAEQQALTMRLRKDRVQDLVGKGLRSRQDLEFAINDLTKAETEVVRARKTIDLAKRDLSVGSLAEEGATVEILRARAALSEAQEARSVADTEIANARLNLARLESDTAANLAKIAADVQSAKESLAKSSADLRKAETDEANLQGRRDQQVVTAPRDGRVVRLMEVGAGGTVKAGDVLATIAPETTDRMVALFLSDNDIPLVAVGRRVRLQFAGWPALQVSGLPGVAVGSFGGEVAFIDPIVTTAGTYAAKEGAGAARYRVLVRPDRQRLPGGRMDEPWPRADRLRPGVECYGWVLLDRVPLGAEVWRQLNRFPPRLPAEGKKEKDPQLGPVKVKSK